MADDDNRAPRDAEAARDLQWGALLEGLAAGCASDAAAARLCLRMPAGELAEARRSGQLTAQAIEALEQGEPLPQRAVPDVAAMLTQVDKGIALRGEELVDVGRALAVARELRVYVQRIAERLPELAAALDSAPELDRLRADLERALDERGNVLDAASKALAEARKRTKSLRQELLAKLSKLASRYGDVLRDTGPVERDGRYTLPVRADAHRRVDGIVVGTSATGATLFVEPPAVTELGNRLRLAEGDVTREEARVLAELSAAVRERLDEVRQAFEACIEADVLAALTKWASDSRGRAVPLDEEASVELRGMRHPLMLLQGAEVVDNDLALRSGQALVISGPNAGGKTVALKCLGLAVWMARAGIPLPVREGSRVGFYDRVLTDIGDQQSLERSLSTFSAEVENLRDMLDAAGERSMVLLDEVAGATDPEEGAALAASVIEALLGRGAAVAATTHYERLKELAAADGRFVNASVGFDFDAMQPTFRLTLGQPGASSALSVAARHGMPAEVIERANALLSAPARDREQLIRDLERERQGLVSARDEAEQEAEQAAALRREIEDERKYVRDKERKKLATEKADLVAQVKRARNQLRELSARLEKTGDARDLRAAERRIDEAAKLVSLSGPLEQATREPPPAVAPVEKLGVGMRVYVERLGADAEIVEAPDRGHVKVQAGAFTLRVPLGELRRSTRAEAKKATRAKPAPPEPAPPTATPERELRTGDNTCDLRGMRVDEALETLDRFVDAMLRRGEAVGFALHGHGTGALRSAVREHLALSSQVAEMRPASIDEGGDAFTVFWPR